MRGTLRAATAAVLTVSALVGYMSVGEAGAVASSASLRWQCNGARLQPTSTNLSRVAIATLCLIERERHVHHMRALHASGPLQQIAASQATEMVLGDYFGDNSIAGWTPMQRIRGSSYALRVRRSLVAAQNIGWGTAGLATPAAMVRGWMLSPPHRRIILTGAYKDIGVGVAPAAPARLTGGASGATYTVEFAARH